MYALQKDNEDINISLNVTDVLMQHLRYHHVYTNACTISANLMDCLTYMRQVAKHMLDYVDAPMTSKLSPDMLPVEDCRVILRHF